MPKGVYKHKKGIRYGMIGHKHSKETREKQKKAKLKNPVRYWLGKKLSSEHNAKLQIFPQHQSFQPAQRRQ